MFAPCSNAARRTCMFSPILATRAWRVESTVWPSAKTNCLMASMSEVLASKAAAATALHSLTKFSSLATKSVSQFSSTSTARPSVTASAIRPSAATRVAFLSAFAKPCLRNQSAAASMLPAFSVSAFLHSIMPAPERSRSSFTRAAVISTGFIPSLGHRARGKRHDQGMARGDSVRCRRFACPPRLVPRFVIVQRRRSAAGESNHATITRRSHLAVGDDDPPAGGHRTADDAADPFDRGRSCHRVDDFLA